MRLRSALRRRLSCFKVVPTVNTNISPSIIQQASSLSSSETLPQHSSSSVYATMNCSIFCVFSSKKKTRDLAAAQECQTTAITEQSERCHIDIGIVSAATVGYRSDPDISQGWLGREVPGQTRFTWQIYLPCMLVHIL